MDIKCRKAGLTPDAAVVVATVRALKMHGGVARDQLRAENVAAVEAGYANLARHLENLQQFGDAGGGVGQPLQRRYRGRARQAQGVVRRARGRGGDRRPLGEWRRGRGAAGRGRRQASPTSGEAEVPGALSRRDAAARQDQDDRAEDLPGEGHRLRRRGRKPARRIAEGRVRAFPDLHRQDAIQLFDRRQRQGRADRPHPGRCARSGCRPGPSSSSRSAARS